MSPTVEDLRAALHEAAEAPVEHAVHRVAGVQRAVVRRRRVQAGGGVAAVVAVVLVCLLAWQVPTRRAAQPAVPVPAPHAPLAPYAAGGKLIGSLSVVPVSGTTRTLTVTPTGWGLALVWSCDPGPTVDLSVGVHISINGHDDIVGGGGCEGSQSSYRSGYGRDRRFWQSLDVQPGRPTIIAVRVVPVMHLDGSATTAGEAGQARLQVGVYQDVPVQDYPFPSRPSEPSAPIEGGYSEEATDVVRVRLPGATGTWSRTVPYSAKLGVNLTATAPGRIEVRVDDHLVGGQASWSYNASSTDVTLDRATLRDAGVTAPADGQPVRLSVVVSEFTQRDWRVVIGRDLTGK